MDPQPSPEANELESAGRLARLGAAAVDGLAAAAPPCAVALLVPSAMLSGQFSLLMAFGAVAGLISVVLLLAQAVLLAKHGQTLGKKLMRIRLITGEGRKAGLGRAFLLRALPFFVTALILELMVKMQFNIRGAGAAFLLLDILLIFRPDRRCLHDLFAGTHVVKA